MDSETYLEFLTIHLQRRGVAEERIGQIVGEMEARLAESKESPVASFGSPADYAEKMATSDEHSRGTSSSENWHKRTFMASAYDEMEILSDAGQEGWELINVGFLSLFCRRPVDLTQAHRWEYKRRAGVNRSGIKKEMAADNWQPCGLWVVLHYFKRDLGPLGEST